MYIPIPHAADEIDTMDTINKWYADFEKRAEKGVDSDRLSKLRDSILDMFDEEIRHLTVLRDLCKTSMDVEIIKNR